MIRYLDWDSAFFGMNMGEVDLCLPFNSAYMHQFIEINHLDFIQALCEINNLPAIHTLEKNSFHMADQKVTLKIALKDTQTSTSTFEKAVIHDLPSLKDIAYNMFLESRYYNFKHIFNIYKVNNLYQLWIEKAVKGSFDDYCMLLKHNNEIAGFATIKENKTQRTAHIGLLGIETRFRNQGLGKTLIKELKWYLSQRQINQLSVATQGKNYKALNLYIKSGFEIDRIESWYYWVR